ncbi:MAG: hypothetical protein M3443_07525 [Actinomycetota bacterium]|nr:hypothetical protein [Actinomycetota bacterium]
MDRFRSEARFADIRALTGRVNAGGLGPPADTPQWGRCHAPIKSRRSALTNR